MKRGYSSLRIDALKAVAGAAGFGAALVLNPRDATAATVSLPQTINAGGASWFVSDSTTAFTGAPGLGLTEASLHGPPVRNDAYDGAWVMQVNGTTFQSPGGVADLTGTTLTTGSVQLSGLDTSAQFFFDTASPTIRAVYSYTNASAAPITVTVTWDNNLGSDSNTIILATSSGDTILDASDRWVISSDGNPAGDPVLSFVRFGPGASITPTNLHSPGISGSPRDRFQDSYTLTVPAGQTRRLMIFGRLSQDQVSAVGAMNSTFSSAANLASAGLLNGLTAQQESEIVNWSPLGGGGNSPAGVPAMGPVGLGILAVLLGALATKYIRWPLTGK